MARPHSWDIDWIVDWLSGALFNAHLNRKRDDRLRAHEARSVAAALQAELSLAEKVFKDNADHLGSTPSGYYMPDPKHSIRVMPDLVSKLGLFESDTIQLVLTSHLMIEQYGQNLVLMGGTGTHSPFVRGAVDPYAGRHRGKRYRHVPKYRS